MRRHPSRTPILPFRQGLINQTRMAGLLGCMTVCARGWCPSTASAGTWLRTRPVWSTAFRRVRGSPGAAGSFSSSLRISEASRTIVTRVNAELRRVGLRTATGRRLASLGLEFRRQAGLRVLRRSRLLPHSFGVPEAARTVLTCVNAALPTGRTPRLRRYGAQLRLCPRLLGLGRFSLCQLFFRIDLDHHCGSLRG